MFFRTILELVYQYQVIKTRAKKLSEIDFPKKNLAPFIVVFKTKAKIVRIKFSDKNQVYF